MRLFFIGQKLQGPAKVGLNEHLADRRGAPARQIDRCIGRPAPIAFLVIDDVLRHQRVHREALARESDRGARNVTEAHGAVALQHGEPRIRCGRHDGAQYTRRHAPAVLLPEHLRTRGPRPDAEPVDRDHFALVRHPQHDRRHAGEVDDIGLQHLQADPGCDAGVDRVAACLEDIEAGMRRAEMAGGDHVPRAGDRGAEGGHR